MAKNEVCRQQIERGADLTDDDLRLMADDLYAVRNWGTLNMHLKADEVREQMFQALRARLGRRELVIKE